MVRLTIFVTAIFAIIAYCHHLEIPGFAKISDSKKKAKNFRCKSEIPALLISLFLSFGLWVIMAKYTFKFSLFWFVFSAISIYYQQFVTLKGARQISRTHEKKIYRLAQIAAEKLNMDIPEIYIMQDDRLNAFSLGFFRSPAVVVNSGLIKLLSEQELLAVLGHEFGHIYLGHTQWSALTQSAGKIRSPILSYIFGTAFLFWSRQAEFSCDRASLIVTNDLLVCKSALIKASYNHVENRNRVSSEVKVDDIYQEKRSIMNSLHELLSTHPQLSKRLKALEVFSQRKTM